MEKVYISFTHRTLTTLQGVDIKLCLYDEIKSGFISHRLCRWTILSNKISKEYLNRKKYKSNYNEIKIIIGIMNEKEEASLSNQ